MRSIDEFCTLGDRARTGSATVDEVARLVAIALDHATDAERPLLEHKKLLRLRDNLVAQPGVRTAERTVRAALKDYERRHWLEDQARGFYSGQDVIRAVCFELMLLSGGKIPSARTLQRRYALAAPTKG